MVRIPACLQYSHCGLATIVGIAGLSALWLVNLVQRDSPRDVISVLDRELNGELVSGLVALACSTEADVRLVLEHGLRVMPIEWLKNPTDCKWIAVSKDLFNDGPNNERLACMVGVLPQLRDMLPINSPLDDVLLFNISDCAPLAWSSCEDKRASSSDLIRSPKLSDAKGAEEPSLSLCCHVMLLRDPETVGLSSVPNFESALRILTDERLAESLFGTSPFIRTRDGVRYRLAKSSLDGENRWAESHRDQCLSTLAALGIPLNFPIILRDEELRVEDLLNESIANFNYEQSELAWTCIAYAHYLAPERTWKDRFNAEYNFSQLLNHVLDEGFEGQSCGGLHVLEATVTILRADSETDILDKMTRARARRFVLSALERASLSQDASGCWGFNWHKGEGAFSIAKSDVQSDVLVTGHMLDLLNHLDRFPLDRNAMEKGTIWVVDRVKKWRHEGVSAAVCPLTHFIRVLAEPKHCTRARAATNHASHAWNES